MAHDDYPTLTEAQRRELNVAIRHLGRAMKALHRAHLPWPLQNQNWLFTLHNGERKVGEASDALIFGFEKFALNGPEPEKY